MLMYITVDLIDEYSSSTKHGTITMKPVDIKRIQQKSLRKKGYERNECCIGVTKSGKD